MRYWQWDHPHILFRFLELVSLICTCRHVYTFACVLSHFSHVWLFATPWTGRLLGSSIHGIFPGKNTGVGCHALLQGIILTQGLNLHLLHLVHCRWILYHWATREAWCMTLLLYNFITHVVVPKLKTIHLSP